MVLRNSTAPECFSSSLSGQITSPWTTIGLLITDLLILGVLQYRRIVMVPGRDIEWELRVPPFRLGPASELIRQINERCTYIRARPLSVPVCHLFVPWILAQSDSSRAFMAALISLRLLTHSGTARTNVGCFSGSVTAVSLLLWNSLRSIRFFFPR